MAHRNEPKRTPRELVVGQIYSAQEIGDLFGIDPADVERGGIIPVPPLADGGARTILAHLNITLADGDTRSVDEITAVIEDAIGVGFDPEHTGGMTPTVALVDEV